MSRDKLTYIISMNSKEIFSRECLTIDRLCELRQENPP
jgi:hypothetical protein